MSIILYEKFKDRMAKKRQIEEIEEEYRKHLILSSPCIYTFTGKYLLIFLSSIKPPS